MKDEMYQVILGVLDLFLWGGRLIGEENLPRRGPAVFISNHLDATGPIAVTCSLPLRVHPWVIADMMDKDLAPTWLRADFVERQLHFKPPLSIWLSRAICSLSVPLFYSLGCIPVYRGDYERIHETMDISMGFLRKGKFVLVFPEDNRLQVDPITKMQPFQHSFARLGEMYFAETGECLQFYPVAVHATGLMVIGKPFAFNPLNPLGLERRRIKKLMENSVRSMYLQLDGKAGNEIRTLALE